MFLSQEVVVVVVVVVSWQLLIVGQDEISRIHLEALEFINQMRGAQSMDLLFFLINSTVQSLSFSHSLHNSEAFKLAGAN